MLDSSVSMLAFRDELNRVLPSRLRSLVRNAARTEWRLIETDPARPTLYAGADLNALLAALAKWNPRLGTHDFQPALNAARSLTRDAGVALFVTDRRAEVPEGVKLLAIGKPIENCGWAGLSVEGDVWRALVKNYSGVPQTRTWRVEADGAVGADATLTLEPGQIRTLSGGFPAGKDHCELVLGTDAFPLDDRLPIVRPQPKRLTLAAQPGTPLDDFFHRLIESVPRADSNIAPGTVADARLGVYPAPPSPNVPGILFAAPDKERPGYLTGELVAENHPLTDGLTWNGLLCKQTDPIPAQDGDEVLLWQGERPLIFLRGARAGRSLLVNFDVRQSNADRLPAFVVLLNRFLESIRAEKVAPERLNVETNQLLQVASDPAQPPPQISSGETSPLRAPAAPGFFTVTQGTQSVPLLTAAAYFSDTRQADFHDAETLDTLGGESARLVNRNSREDTWWPVAALLLGAVCVASWERGKAE